MVGVLFVHPDLGIGGAERLVVDAAMALQKSGHDVHIVTSHHNPDHCFPETRDGSLQVTVAGDWLPRSLFGKFFALCAYIRSIYTAFYIVFFSGLKPDVIFCDQISICIPILRVSFKNIIFYCHFPDLLLTDRKTTLKSMYRLVLDWAEEYTTALASKILVNSHFTRNVFSHTFRTIRRKPEVVYPSIHTDTFDNTPSIDLSKVINKPLPEILFLSINRFERKKNLNLALESMVSLKLKLNSKQWNRVHLIIAGGYDPRVVENIQHLEELERRAVDFGLKDNVTFLKSPSDKIKLTLLRTCHCLLYTPRNEHFGIVPLEAMYAQRPVIAVCSGGPTETILDGETGFLCEDTPKSFANAMALLIEDEDLAERMGEEGGKRFKEKFSFQAFTKHLENIVQQIVL